MGCRPSKRRIARLSRSSALVNSHDNQVVGTMIIPSSGASFLFAKRESSGDKFKDDEPFPFVEQPFPESSYDRGMFNEFSMSSATYRQRGRHLSERITVRLSNDGTTLEIEHIERNEQQTTIENREHVRKLERSLSAPCLRTNSVVPLTDRSTEIASHSRTRDSKIFPTQSKTLIHQNVVLRQGPRRRKIYSDRCVSFPYSTSVGEKLRAIAAQRESPSERNSSTNVVKTHESNFSPYENVRQRMCENDVKTRLDELSLENQMHKGDTIFTCDFTNFVNNGGANNVNNENLNISHFNEMSDKFMNDKSIYGCDILSVVGYLPRTARFETDLHMDEVTVDGSSKLCRNMLKTEATTANGNSHLWPFNAHTVPSDVTEL